jgi:hypothetical protein
VRTLKAWASRKKDATKDIARELAEIATHIGQLKGEANAYLRDPGYDRLKLRLKRVPSLR